MPEDTFKDRVINREVGEREESDQDVDDMMDAISEKTPGERLALLKSLQETEDIATRIGLIKDALGISVSNETINMFVHKLEKTY